MNALMDVHGTWTQGYLGKGSHVTPINVESKVI